MSFERGHTANAVRYDTRRLARVHATGSFPILVNSSKRKDNEMTEQETKKRESNNTVILIGNTGAEAEERTITGTNESFVTLSLYTSNSYKDDSGELKEYPSTRHDIVAFDPWLQRELQSFKAGTRLRIEGKLSYRAFEVMIDGQSVKKRETSIIAKKVETAVLPSKKKSDSQDAEKSKELETA